LCILNFSKEELLLANNITKLDSIPNEENHIALEIKSIRIHLNDGSCQGLFHYISKILKCILIVIFIVLDVSQIRAVEIKKICYVWCDIQGKFQKLVGLDRGLTTAQLHTYKGYSVQEQLIRYYIVYKRCRYIY